MTSGRGGGWGVGSVFKDKSLYLSFGLCVGELNTLFFQFLQLSLDLWIGAFVVLLLLHTLLERE